VDLIISHPMQMALAAAGTIHTLTTDGVHAGLVPTMETDMDNVMDIKEVSQSQF
jgi:hypothetical protein